MSRAAKLSPLYLEGQEDRIELLSESYKKPSQIYVSEICKKLIRVKRFNDICEDWIDESAPLLAQLKIRNYSTYSKKLNQLYLRRKKSTKEKKPGYTKWEVDLLSMDNYYHEQLERWFGLPPTLYPPITEFVLFNTISEKPFLFVEKERYDNCIHITLYPGVENISEVKSFIDTNWPSISEDLHSMPQYLSAYHSRKLTPSFKRDLEIYYLSLNGSSTKEVLDNVKFSIDEEQVRKIVSKEKKLHSDNQLGNYF